ncbi:MAG TPA: YncE family protein, partial [Nitrososphaeraceae archaeon]|nr:YncE family protein [Nitrososphaeraceae archaeon]
LIMIKQTTPNIVFLTFTILITIFMLSILYLPSQSSFAHHIVKEIAVTERPMKMSLDEPLLFVSNLGQPVVSIISTVSDEAVGTINTTQGVIDVEGVNDKNKLYVATFQTGEIEVYDITTKKLIKTIPIPGSTIQYPHRLADTALVTSTVITGGSSLEYNPNNELLYIANYNTDEIIVIDTKNNDTIVKTIQVSAHPIDVKVDPVTNQVLVTSFASKKLTFISGDTNEITGTVDTGISPWGIGIDNGKHLAYIGHHNSPYIAVVDILSKKVIKQIPIGFEGQSVAVDTNEHKIYVSFHDIDKVVKINGNNNEIETVIELDGRTPNDIAVDSISHKLYASIKSSNNLFVMGPESYALNIPVVTNKPPILFVDNIIAHSQDVQILNPVLMDTQDNNDNLTSAAILDSENKTLSMQVSSFDGGDLQIKMPKGILNAITEGGEYNITVLIDGVKTEFTEIPSSNVTDQQQQKDISKEISVFIPKGDKKVEILGKDIS